MSKTITIEIERGYVCDDLELLRKMSETKDFSSLDAVIERIQQKVNNMESGLYNSKYRRAWVALHRKKEEISEELIDEIKKEYKLKIF